MLTITIPSAELWDEAKEEFIPGKEQTLQLEHSLVALSKWEAKWHKPYLTKEEKTNEETIDYFRFMTITRNVDPDIYYCLTPENIRQILDYIDNPMTATTIREDKKSANGEQVTSELIYYWMISLNIPVEFQKWHLNRLLTLVKVCNVKNGPSKKMSKKEIMSRNASLNAARKKQFNTKG